MLCRGHLSPCPFLSVSLDNRSTDPFTLADRTKACGFQQLPADLPRS